LARKDALYDCIVHRQETDYRKEGKLGYNEKMKKVAIFDIDGTIFRSSLLIQIVERLIDCGIFRKSAMQEFAREKIAWLDRRGDYEAYIQAVIKTFLKYIKGVAYSDFSRIAEEVVAEQKDRVYRFTRDLIKNLKKKRYFLLAISHSPKVVLDHFCRRLGFDKVYGIFYEIGPTDRFTGKVAEEGFILNKAFVVQHALEKEGLMFAGSIGVGDTESDIPFLELVDEAICFNPNSRLYARAKRGGWRVIVERKDVIYEIV
jgi:HAD superfamily hydrolase (TIGR01490 family)